MAELTAFEFPGCARRSLIRCLLLILVLPAPGAANPYSPPGFYDVEHLTFDNGFQLVLKHRGGARNVSLRLVVDVGWDDFPCGRKEVPHFLEHLLFTGTSNHTETELEQIMEERGGSWNAFVSDYRTGYLMDIYSGSLDFAVDLLFEILTDSTLSQENIELSRDIIHRESGGLPNPVVRWLYRYGLGKSGDAQALQALGLQCEEYETLEVSREDILAAYQTYYGPGQMTLVLVGDFQRDAVMERVGASFGAMSPRPTPPPTPAPPPLPTEALQHSSILSPVVGRSANVSLFYPTAGSDAADRHVLAVMTRYLDNRLYDLIRVKSALSYSPGASQGGGMDRGTLYAYADVDAENAERVLDKMQHEIESMATGEIDPEAFERAKQAILLTSAQGVEANSDFASYYAAVLFELEEPGHFVNEEDAVEAVTQEDAVRVAGDLLVEGRSVRVINRPTLGFGEFGIVLMVGVAGAGALGWRWWRRRRGRRDRAGGSG